MLPDTVVVALDYAGYLFCSVLAFVSLMVLLLVTVMGQHMSVEDILETLLSCSPYHVGRSLPFCSVGVYFIVQ